ncbi:MAG: TetR/AcrR family transcriptional regulator [Acidobacteriota bacterium]
MPWEKQFDVDETLAKAGEAFWAQGYEATSMHDLLNAMGIQKGSFYSTYGSKHEAYLKALEQYAGARNGELKDLVRDLEPIAALERFFDLIAEDCLGPTGYRGCMVINCALERAYDDPEAQAVVQRALASNERLLRELIQAGQQIGEIDTAVDAAATAKAMMAIVMGMRVYSRSGADPDSVRILADQALRLIGSTRQVVE